MVVEPPITVDLPTSVGSPMAMFTHWVMAYGSLNDSHSWLAEKAMKPLSGSLRKVAMRKQV